MSVTVDRDGPLCMRLNKYPVLLIIITILGAALRIFRLSARGIWYDEAWSLVLAAKDLSRSTYFDVFSYKPVYFLFLNAWVRLFGLDAFWVRLPSVVFASLSLGVIYLVGRELADNKTGLLAAFLLAWAVVNAPRNH